MWGVKKKLLQTQIQLLISPTNTVELNMRHASQKQQVRNDKKENVTSKLAAIRIVSLFI